MIHSLIESYGLLEKLVKIDFKKADEEVLSGFHSVDYVNCMKENTDEDGNEEYGLG